MMQVITDMPFLTNYRVLHFRWISDPSHSLIAHGLHLTFEMTV